jgi:hypothetical protein
VVTCRSVRRERRSHCPDSNLFLNSGRMRLDRARSLGVPRAGRESSAGRTSSTSPRHRPRLRQRATRQAEVSAASCSARARSAGRKRSALRRGRGRQPSCRFCRAAAAGRDEAQLWVVTFGSSSRLCRSTSCAASGCGTRDRSRSEPRTPALRQHRVLTVRSSRADGKMIHPR